MKTAVSVTAAILASIAVLGAPQAGYAGDPLGRFTLTPAGESFVRLDTATGAVSLCGAKAQGFVCETAADDASALKREIDRLAEENDALKRQLAEHEPSAKPAAPDEAPAPPPADPSLHAPELDFDQMTELAAKILRRFQDMVRELKQEDTGKEL